MVDQADATLTGKESFRVDSTVLPTGDNMPSPVTTTRRLDTFVLGEENRFLWDKKDKTQAVE